MLIINVKSFSTNNKNIVQFLIFHPDLFQLSSPYKRVGEGFQKGTN